eukprot:m.256034 g.256034  ORF g.256034 m.256034 type:complete len:124 (+) comp26570_c0_seq2:4669-5040(+)
MCWGGLSARAAGCTRRTCSTPASGTSLASSGVATGGKRDDGLLGHGTLTLPSYGAGYSTTRVREGVLHVDSGMLRQGLDRLKSADDLRAGLRTFRLDEVRKGRSKLSGSALAKTTPCAKTPLH